VYNVFRIHKELLVPALIILIVFIVLVASMKGPEVSPVPVRPEKAEPRAKYLGDR
jgi:hypothetical protein